MRILVGILIPFSYDFFPFFFICEKMEGDYSLLRMKSLNGTQGADDDLEYFILFVYLKT